MYFLYLCRVIVVIGYQFVIHSMIHHSHACYKAVPFTVALVNTEDGEWGGTYPLGMQCAIKIGFLLPTSLFSKREAGALRESFFHQAGDLFEGFGVEVEHLAALVVHGVLDLEPLQAVDVAQGKH